MMRSTVSFISLGRTFIPVFSPKFETSPSRFPPKIISNPEALETGVVLRYLMGAGELTIGIILYLARISIKSGAQRLLLGSGIGFMIIFTTAVFIIIKYKANIPILALSIYPLLAILSVVTF
jgi:vacuolar-type H+-ATPase subunit I/STV1